MNFYFFSILLILCFCPLATAGEFYFGLRKNSIGVAAEASKKKFNGDSGLVLNRVTSQAKTWAHWLRKLLKSLRKWCHSHPPEVKLAKCFASYFNIKIPGLRQREKIGRHDEISKEREFPRKMERRRVAIFSTRRTFLNFPFPDASSLSLVFNFFRVRFSNFRDVIYSHDLTGCVWDYFWKKFWNWVDSAPESWF